MKNDPAPLIALTPTLSLAGEGGGQSPVSSTVSRGRGSRSARVAVVVLGDLGRSPRMLYHALSLADAGAEVELLGHGGSELPAAVCEHPRVRVHVLPDRARERRSGFLSAALRRAVRQALGLRNALRRMPPLDVVLVQNPPAFPSLAVARLATRRHGARLVIDWHNFGYSMLALRLGASHPAVRLSASYEGALGRGADAHLCVSRAMQQALAERWRIEATPLHDRPAARFVPLAAPEREAAARALCAEAGVSGRPALIVSPTSWTPDEPFELLLDAGAAYEERRAGGAPLPELLVVVSGRGPLRSGFEARLAARPPGAVHVRTLWRAAADYPRLLAAADLGLCLHRSASGLDLPMKIADMFGAGTPVCALDYGPCLREMVRPDSNGALFATAAELADRLAELLAGFPAETARLDTLRRGALAEAAGERWEQAWTARAQPIILPRAATSVAGNSE